MSKSGPTPQDIIHASPQLELNLRALDYNALLEADIRIRTASARIQFKYWRSMLNCAKGIEWATREDASIAKRGQEYWQLLRCFHGQISYLAFPTSNFAHFNRH